MNLFLDQTSPTTPKNPNSVGHGNALSQSVYFSALEPPQNQQQQNVLPAYSAPPHKTYNPYMTVFGSPRQSPSQTLMQLSPQEQQHAPSPSLSGSRLSISTDRSNIPNTHTKASVTSSPATAVGITVNTSGSNSKKTSKRNGNSNTSPKNNGKAKIKCTYEGCEKSFTTKAHAKRHMRIHINMKPYKCPIEGCTSAFARQDNMKQHYKSHLKRIEDDSDSLLDTFLSEAKYDRQRTNSTDTLLSHRTSFSSDGLPERASPNVNFSFLRTPISPSQSTSSSLNTPAVSSSELDSMFHPSGVIPPLTSVNIGVAGADQGFFSPNTFHHIQSSDFN